MQIVWEDDRMVGLGGKLTFFVVGWDGMREVLRYLVFKNNEAYYRYSY